MAGLFWAHRAELACMAQRGMGLEYHKMEMVVWAGFKEGNPTLGASMQWRFWGPWKEVCKKKSGTLFACFIGATNDISLGQNGNLDVFFVISALTMVTGNTIHPDGCCGIGVGFACAEYRSSQGKWHPRKYLDVEPLCTRTQCSERY